MYGGCVNRTNSNFIEFRSTGQLIHIASIPLWSVIKTRECPGKEWTERPVLLHQTQPFTGDISYTDAYPRAFHRRTVREEKNKKFRTRIGNALRRGRTVCADWWYIERNIWNETGDTMAKIYYWWISGVWNIVLAFPVKESVDNAGIISGMRCLKKRNELSVWRRLPVFGGALCI